MAAIIESSEDAIIGQSLTGKILSWNAGACRLYGYTEGEAVGQRITFLVAPEHGKEIELLLERVGRGEHIRQFETTRQRKSGELVEVSLCLSPVRNNAGKIVGVSTIARDIADRKRAEREREKLVGDLREEVAEREEAQRALQQSQELTLRQERLAAVGQLAAGLAHEFNNILTIIEGYAALLVDNPSMDEDAVKSVNHITEGVERTAALVKQMLVFSRKQVMQQQVVHIQETMRQIADMLGRLLGKHVELRYDIAPQLPPIMADPQMLQQIIANLIVNARDAMSSAGRLTIGAARVTFSAADLAGKPDRRAGQFIRLSISDTGAGMDTAVINHLFEPFFTTKDIGKGCGMGLATVYGMVNQNSGWIEVESTVGKGTTFNLFFPVTEETPEKAAPETPAPRAVGGRETVLVVEDETILRELVREILKANGYRVLDAATGREALAVWEKEGRNVDLLLTDVAMPDGLSGRDLATKLQEDNPRLPVIFSSGYTQESLQRKEPAGASETFLPKPYQPAELARIVRASLDNAVGAQLATAAPKP